MTAREITVGDVPVRALRVTFVGELGWELYASTEYGAGAVGERSGPPGTTHGLVAGGYRAIESMRLEKGYRVWGSDITAETTPYEAGLGFCVKLDKPGGFEGREALVAAKRARAAPAAARDRARRSATGSCSAASRCGSAAAVVGRVTSGGFGYTRRRVDRLRLPADRAPTPGTAVEHRPVRRVGRRRRGRASRCSIPRRARTRLMTRSGCRPYHSGVTGPSTPPRIGLTTYREPAAWGVWDEPADLLPATYADAVRAAGGVAAAAAARAPSRRSTRPPSRSTALRRAAARRRRGRRPGAVRRRARRRRPAPARPTATPGRSRWRAPRSTRDLPVLGVCRGMQVLNVALGGTLRPAPARRRRHRRALPGRRRARPARRCASPAGIAARARCSATQADGRDLPPQAVDRLGDGPDRRPAGPTTARSRRSSTTGRRWVVGVQWHPEVHDGARAVRALRRGLRGASGPRRRALTSSRAGQRRGAVGADGLLAGAGPQRLRGDGRAARAEHPARRARRRRAAAARTRARRDLRRQPGDAARGDQGAARRRTWSSRGAAAAAARSSSRRQLEARAAAAQIEQSLGTALDDALDLRRVVEPGAAALAATRTLTAADRATLHRCLRRGDRLRRRRPPAGRLAAAHGDRRARAAARR